MSTEPIPGRCGRKKSSGAGFCEAYPVNGAPVCRKHGGAAPQVKAKAQARIAKAEAERAAQRMVADAGVDTDPLDHLLECLYRAAALVEVWGSMVADIDAEAERNAVERDEIRGGLNYIESTDEKNRDELVVMSSDKLLALNAKGEASVHPYMTEYQQALDRKARFAKMCLDAGVAERQVKVAEQQAEIVVNAFTKTLAAHGIERDKALISDFANNLRFASAPV